MLNALTTRLRPAHKLLISGAWFFIILSLLQLASVVGVKLGDPAGITRLYSTTVGSETYDAWGLTYTDTPGLIRAMLQIAVVIVVATATTLAPRSQRRIKLRRIGHAVLFVWSAWWSINLLRLAGIDHQINSMLTATLLTGMTGCTLYRASLGWCKKECGVERQSSPPQTAPPLDGKEIPDSPSPTHAFFAAIAPEIQAASEALDMDEQFEVEIKDTSTPAARPSLLTRLRNFFRRGKANVQQHVNREKLARWKGKANHVAHQGHDLVVKKGGRFARRAKPVAKTAFREAKNAWRKTIDALKDAEQMKTNEAPASPKATENVV